MEINDIITKIESIADKFEAKLAIKTIEKELTYGDLNKLSNAVSSAIIKKLGNNGENPKIALLIGHNEKMVIGILGAVKAKTTYVPLGNSQPIGRLETMIKDAEAEIILTDNENLPIAYKLSYKLTNKTIINIDDLDKSAETKINSTGGNKEAYIIYTSGSTGKPKGVVQEWLSVNNFIDHYISELDINKNDNILLTTPFSHTVSVIDMYSALFTGASLIIYDIKNNFDVSHFIEYLKTSNTTIIHTVPVFFRYFAEKINDKLCLSSARLLILGGEDVSVLDFELYKKLFPSNAYFINLYGLSEVLIGSINILTKESVLERSAISIGYPVEIINNYVINENKYETMVFETGELFFEGENLTTKYHNLEEDTEKLYDSYQGKKVLRTGDLVKKLPDGTLEYVGRKDFEFKIQGNRVNAKEIETVLDATGLINKSIVLPLKNDKNENYIVAYYLSDKKDDELKEKIYDILKDQLPEYMFPSYFIQLENFPLNENGKIDRNKLPKITQEGNDIESDETIKSIHKIWKDVFKNNDIKIYDNFFQLGGNSLIATEIINTIFFEFDVEIKLNTIFENQTIIELSKIIKKIKQDTLVNE